MSPDDSVQLKEYIDQRLDDRDTHNALLIGQLNERLSKQDENIQRLYDINRQKSTQLVHSDLYEAQLENALRDLSEHKAQAEMYFTRISSLEKQLSDIRGRLWALSVGLAFLSLSTSIVLHFWVIH